MSDEKLEFNCENCGDRYNDLNLIVINGVRYSVCDNCYKNL